MDKSRSDTVELIGTQAIESKGIELAERLQAHQDGEANRKARTWLHKTLLALLGFEVLFIAYIMLSQGIKMLLFTKIPFELNEWAFGLFINVALVQTCILIRPIAQNLFPVPKPKK